MNDLALALKTAFAMKEYTDAQQEKIKKDKKEWDENVLTKGGVTYFAMKTPDGKTKKVKISVLTEKDEFNVISSKGKFLIKNAMGNKIYMSVKSYKEADMIIGQIYGSGMYRVTTEML